MRVLAVDAGKSRCKVAWCEPGQPLRRAEGAGVPHSAEPDAATRVTEAIAALVPADGEGGDGWDVVVAGATGVPGPGPAADALTRALQRRLQPRERTVVTSDVVLAHLGALGGEAGTVVVAGTGAIALAVSAAGATARSDGWGYLLGDDGSGFALGRAGLAAALRAFDGREGGSPALLAALRRDYGEPARLVDAVYGAARPARAVAAFAPAVIAAADAGDEVAAEACDAVGMALAASVQAAARRAGVEEGAVSWQGGLLEARRISRRLVDSLEVVLPLAVVRAPAGDALEGGLLLARHGPGPLAAQITVMTSAGAKPRRMA